MGFSKSGSLLDLRNSDCITLQSFARIRGNYTRREKQMKEATNVNTGDVIQVQNASYEVLQVVPDAVYMFEEYGITAALVQRKNVSCMGAAYRFYQVDGRLYELVILPKSNTRNRKRIKEISLF